MEELKNTAAVEAAADNKTDLSGNAVLSSSTPAPDKPATGATAAADTAATAQPASEAPKKPKKVIIVKDLGMRFRTPEEKVDSLKEMLIRLVRRDLNFKEFWALKDVSFTVRKGERVGILGLNGAGKSTLLKCIAGVLKPSEGSVTVKGSVVPLLELGAGFDREYTGAENIYLYGAMLGYSKEFIRKKYDRIVEFSELGDFINVPVKNYSSGMKARLGFSIATIVNPQILILDEVLSVGDAKFKKKSAKKLKSMMSKGVTVLLVSHSTDQVREICDRAIILDHGRLIASGKCEKVCKIYEQRLQ